MAESDCSNCRFYLQFTPFEEKYLNNEFSKHGTKQHYIGACVFRSRRDNRLVRIYISRLRRFSECPYLSPGKFEEYTKTKCPECKTGYLVLRRLINNKTKQSFVLIGCSRFPKCEYSSKVFTLHTTCRFCGNPLILETGSKMSIVCPNCQRRALVPLTPRCWPTIFGVQETGDLMCPHHTQIEQCHICKQTVSEKTNLVVIELKESLIVTERTQSINEGRYGNANWAMVDNDFDEHLTDYDEEIEEEIELINDELDEDRVNLWRSNENGWFYSDTDGWEESL